MNTGEMVGGVLDECRDPKVSAEALHHFLADHSLSLDDCKRYGLDAKLVAILRQHLPRDDNVTRVACELGVAWVEGRRSVKRSDSWEPVLSVGPSMGFPPGARRGTAETLIGMINEAEKTIRVTAPFVDDVGLGYLLIPLAAATTRGVREEFIFSGESEWLTRAIAALQGTLRREGSSDRVVIARTKEPLPWPHLKVVSVDGMVAYIGSANITGAALAGRNLELGVLVRGESVKTIDAILDLIPVDREIRPSSER